ncbi:hypothetical protein JHW33_23200 (plasmid) [Rahnella aceris]|nr:hypothetical protein JHW33_23200 [Rahnella aceris]
MKKSRFTEEQIIFALKSAELGTSVPDVCRKLRYLLSSMPLFTPGERNTAELPLRAEVHTVTRLRLKSLAADLILDKVMLARLHEWGRDLQARYGTSESQIFFALLTCPQD